MESILRQIEKLNMFDKLYKALSSTKGEHAVFGVSGTQKYALSAATISKLEKQTIIVAVDERQAIQWVEQLKRFNPNREVIYFPENDLRIQSMLLADSHDIVKMRIEAIHALAKGEGTIVSTVSSLMQLLPKPETINELTLTIELNSEFKQATLIEKLINSGYERKIQVDSKAQFSIRGAIIDIYPLNRDNPIRVEMFGDEVDSIREFDVADQRTIKIIEKANVSPAYEMCWKESSKEGLTKLENEIESMKVKVSKDVYNSWEQDLIRLKDGSKGSQYSQYSYYFLNKAVSLFSFVKDDSFVIWDDPARLEEKANLFLKEIEDDPSILPIQKNGYKHYKDLVEEASEKGRSLTLSLLTRKVRSHQPVSLHSFVTKEANNYHGQINFLKNDIDKWINNKYKVVLAVPEKKADELYKYFASTKYDVLLMDDLGDDLPNGTLVISKAELDQGFEMPELSLIVLTEKEIFGIERKKKMRISNVEDKAQKRLLDYRELEVGDYVVHVSHGIGVYQGIKTMEINDIQKDYISIRYKGKDRLFVPIDQIHLVQKYIGAEGKRPKIYSLGTSDWQRVKNRVKKSIQDMAKELLYLYAEREKNKGYAFPEDNEWQKEFEESFPYQETRDQLKAIEEVKDDMMSDKPMDRLLCGDVGFGKTEVALRAAFKAATDGKQVAILVPTTILAHQHYQTMLDRMSKFPLKIAMLSRFRTRKENEKTIYELNAGLVDIVVGTHSLLNDKIKFKDLGLLIIDEEQRFGVRHKEKIKKMKSNIDVLSLSATPIPRTLHMSMVGMRDLTLIETPPENRYPIQTYVIEYQDKIITEAIKREIERNGQIYFLHNRVKDIEFVAAKLEKMIPHAKIAVGHGQMGERQLERIMIDFHKKEYDVLVSTTIIESGLDIPNVNTLIVEDADKLGLAQLYQIRGRVGRTDRLAYAFLTYKKSKVLSEVAEKRLTAVKEFTELGSGFKIALRDMQIRGAGNILGPEQSGFMIQVGYDLYVQLLEEAVNELKGIKENKPVEVDLDLNISAYIPDRYIKNSDLKIEMYKKIIAINSENDYLDIVDELIDRYGEPPMSVRNLILVAQIRSMAEKLSVVEIKRKNLTYQARFSQNANVSPKLIQDLWHEYQEKIQMVPQDLDVILSVKMDDSTIENQLLVLKSIFLKLIGEDS
ncbi:MAG: transcription-repair coupling factor [Clostridia bacterium]